MGKAVRIVGYKCDQCQNEYKEEPVVVHTLALSDPRDGSRKFVVEFCNALCWAVWAKLHEVN